MIGWNQRAWCLSQLLFADSTKLPRNSVRRKATLLNENVRKGLREMEVEGECEKSKLLFLMKIKFTIIKFVQQKRRRLEAV